MQVRIVFPSSGDSDVSVDVAYATPLGGRDDRPWVALCMVTSIDGSTALDHKSAGLSSPTDAAVLARLRAIADVVVVGAGTARAERYGPPRTAGQRIGVVTTRGSVDATTPLFSSGAGFVITTQTAQVPAGVDALRVGRDAVDLVAAINRLNEIVPGCATVHVEGGPHLNGSLFDADLIDEINVTTSPATVGGDGSRLASGARARALNFEVAQVALDDSSFVYTRWRRRR